MSIVDLLWRMVQRRPDVDDGRNHADFCRRLRFAPDDRPGGYVRRHRLVRDHRSRVSDRYRWFACGRVQAIGERAAGSVDDFDGDPISRNVLDIGDHFELVAA